MSGALAFLGLAIVGTLVRYFAARANTASAPWGTLFVNVVGSFALGWASTALPETLTLIGTGLLGSFTTLSTLAHESVSMGREGHPGKAAAYLGISVVTGVAAAWLGLETGT